MALDALRRADYTEVLGSMLAWQEALAVAIQVTAAAGQAVQRTSQTGVLLEQVRLQQSQLQSVLIAATSLIGAWRSALAPPTSAYARNGRPAGRSAPPRGHLRTVG